MKWIEKCSKILLVLALIVIALFILSIPLIGTIFTLLFGCTVVFNDEYDRAFYFLECMHGKIKDYPATGVLMALVLAAIQLAISCTLWI